MSYSINLLFKNIEKQNVLNFISEVKEKFLNIENQKYLIEQNIFYTPYLKYDERKKSEYDLSNIVRDWAFKLFTYKFTYIEKYSILIMISPEYSFLEDMFDTSLYAQNSTDQDYDYNIWEPIPAFKELSNRIQSMTKEEFKNYVNNLFPNYFTLDENDLDDTEIEKGYSDSKSHLEYWKKSIIYKIIYDNIEDKIWGNNKDNFSISFITDYINLIDIDNLIQHVCIDKLKEYLEKKIYTLEDIDNNYPKFLINKLKKMYK